MDDQEQDLGRALQRHLAALTGEPVTLRETHISWVLLTPHLAFKLKKPVRLPFLDFSTRELRRHFCEEELRLNRRLAPSLYLGVVPVRGTPAEPRLGGSGDPIDHAVCMRRFDDDALLKDRLAAGRLEPHRIDRLAQRIAAFHLQAPRATAEPREDEVEEALKPVRSVLAQLISPQVGMQSDDRRRLARLQEWIEARGHELRANWASRRQAGAIRECHGDLHLGNTIAVGDDDATAFDCIEFDPSLRWIDVMSEVAFLVMDLKAHDRCDLAFRFLDSYLQDCGDYEGLAVLRHYEVYRALVRMLVVRLSPAARAPDYLRCAERIAAGEGAPRLLITSGPSGSGKSTVAKQLLEHAGAIRLRSDVERKRLFGLAAGESSSAAGVDIYTSEATARTFARLADLACVALQAGYPVIVDAAFLRRVERQRFGDLAQRLDVPFTILRLTASEATLSERIRRRGALGEDASEADAAVLQRQLREWSEPLDEVEREHSIEVDTDLPTDVRALARRWSSILRPGC